MQMIFRRFLKLYCAVVRFVGVVPTVVFCCCTLFLLPEGVETGVLLPCYYYPLIGPFELVREQSFTIFDSLQMSAILILPLFLWRIFYRGRNRFVRTMLELWFALPWAIYGIDGYFRDCTSSAQSAISVASQSPPEILDATLTNAVSVVPCHANAYNVGQEGHSVAVLQNESRANPQLPALEKQSSPSEICVKFGQQQTQQGTATRPRTAE